MTILWEKNYGAALARARSENKPLYLDFFHPS
jgi:hypothetical protein